jgi:hypothetical protein
MTAELRLLEYGLSISHHLEPAAARRDQLDLGVRIRVANRGRQTGGPGFVVSNDAEFDRNAHGSW